MTTNEANSEHAGLSKRGLARALGLSPSMVLKLQARGMPVDSVEAARAWRVANLDPLRIKASNARAERHGQSDALLRARVKREETEADIAALKLAELRGELVRADAVRSELARVLVRARDAFLSMPARLAPSFAACTDEGDIRRQIDDEVRRILTNLAADRA